MSRQMVLAVMIVGCWVLSVGHPLGAEPPKVRTDLTGRTNLTPEEMIEGLKPQGPEVRTRGLKPTTTRGLQPGLSAIAVTVQFAFDSDEILPRVSDEPWGHLSLHLTRSVSRDTPTARDPLRIIRGYRSDAPTVSSSISCNTSTLVQTVYSPRAAAKTSPLTPMPRVQAEPKIGERNL
jgi:hypothetical protein